MHVLSGGELTERVVASFADELAVALQLPCLERQLLLSRDDGHKLYKSRHGYKGARDIIDAIPRIVERPTHVGRYDAATRRFRIVRHEPNAEPAGAVVGKVVSLSGSAGAVRFELRLVTAFRVNSKWVSRQVRNGTIREAMPNAEDKRTVREDSRNG